VIDKVEEWMKFGFNRKFSGNLRKDGYDIEGLRWFEEDAWKAMLRAAPEPLPKGKFEGTVSAQFLLLENNGSEEQLDVFLRVKFSGVSDSQCFLMLRWKKGEFDVEELPAVQPKTRIEGSKSKGTIRRNLRITNDDGLWAIATYSPADRRYVFAGVQESSPS